MPDKARLRQLISEHFQVQDLKILLFDWEEEIDYESLEGTGKDGKIIGLITYVEKRGLLEGLIGRLVLARDHIDWATELYGDNLPAFFDDIVRPKSEPETDAEVYEDIVGGDEDEEPRRRLNFSQLNTFLIPLMHICQKLT